MRTSPSPIAVLTAAALAASALAPAARAELKPNQVLVVVNDSSPISTAIGSYYASIRNIPPAQIFHLPAGTTTSESIQRADYNAQVRDPIKNYLSVTAPSLQNQIRCILLTKDVPLRVENSVGTPFTTTQSVASVDSELTQLFTGKVPDAGQAGWLGNPYYNSQYGFEQVAPVPHAGISYLVCRLDGYADQIDPGTGVPIDIKNLIDRAQHPSASGTYIIDGDPTKTGGYAQGETWLNAASTLLTNAGASVIHDATTTFLANQPNILGYASWGSNDSNSLGPPYYGTFNGNTVPGAFLPGSIASDFVSTSARTFAWPGSYGQSLTADLIRMGCTAAIGNTYEPFLTACAQPDKLFPNYLRGFSVAECCYSSIQFLSWETVVVCDPLMTDLQVTSTVTSVFPQIVPQAGGTSVAIGGTNFTSLGDTSVTLNGVPITPTSVGKSTILITTPPLPPGPKTIIVTNSSGTFTCPMPLVAGPGLNTTQPTPPIGTQWTFTVYGLHAQDAWGIFDGTPAPATPIAPFGDFLLDFNQPIISIMNATMPFPQTQQTITVTLPNDPMLQGTVHAIQGIVGGGVSAPSDFKLTNLMIVTIQ